MKLEEVNSLPAYAVYKNLVPGVRVYQDTNTPKKNKGQKKKSVGQAPKGGKAPVKAEVTLLSAARENDVVVEGGKQGTSKLTKVSEKQKNKKLKRKADAVTPGTAPLTEAQISKRSKGEEAPKKASTNNVSENSKKGGKSPKKTGDVPVNNNGLNTSAEKLPNGVEKKKKRIRNKGGIKNPVEASNNGVMKEVKEVNKQKTKERVAPPTVSNCLVVGTSPRENSSNKMELNEIPLISLMSSKSVEDSVEHGKNLFQWLISPTPVTKFRSENWEKAPLLIKRSDPEYYKWLLSSALIDEILRKNTIRFGKNIDVTSYTNGQRETHNPVGRAMPAAVWDYYSNGCSIRFLNPQTYVKPLWRLNALLQEYFGTFVGANVYLTPADSQGFAPHYDDIEAFVLQVEGRKHWKVYKPRSKDEELPRFSSTNFSEEQDNIGEPVLDVILEEGDLLYFPRGFIHQAKAVGEHSLHITVSCYQMNSWGDLMKEYLSSAVDVAMTSKVDFRKGLPTDYLSYMGIVHQNSKNKIIVSKRKAFMNNTKKLVEQILQFTTPDIAADQMGKKFIWDSLPPFLTARERNTSAANDGEFMEEGQVFNRCELDPDTEVKLLRKNCIRLVFEENSFRLYFSLENSLEYHGEEAQFVEIPEDAKDAVNFLISKYPDFVKIDDLPIEDLTTKVQLVADLWEKGMILTKNPLSPVWDESLMDSEEEEDESSEDESEDLGSEDSIDEDDSDDDSENFSYDYDEFIEDNFGEGADCFDSDVESLEEESEDSQDSGGLGKSYIEEVTSGDEFNASNRNGPESSEDDVPPQLISIRPKQKIQKSKIKNSK
ncbi:unnamed protein product [Allacma fusca]|uniref:Bifunctional lysine-specific demethylase and histidyl-hydroxylase n=1 Tax=Allacma fusca TaxID=39272 RepID=A0A8J2LT41_9HEXA|nr:unnamed protein product [Allacma fusca]